jgi:hypothetical protein
MTSILDGLRADVTAAFDGTLRDGTLYRQGEGEDEYGNPIPGVWESLGTFQGLRANYDAAYAAQAGIPRTAARIEILAASLATAPMRDDRINIEDSWWLITELEVDPADAWFIAECIAASAVP